MPPTHIKPAYNVMFITNLANYSADYFPNKNEIVIESLDEQTKQYLELNGFTLQEI